MKLVCVPGDPEYIEPGSPGYDDVIGCSRVADILGFGFKSPNALWMQMTHRAPKTEHKAIFDRGHEMEPIMAKALRERHGRDLKSEQVQYRDPDRPWLIAHVDGMFPKHVPLESGKPVLEGPGLWEAKAPGYHSEQQMGRDGITKAYLCQVQMGMHVAGMAMGLPIQWGTCGYLAYNEWELVPIDVKASWEFQRNALDKIEAFYECLCTDTPPEPINLAELPPVPGFQTDLHVSEDEEVARLSRDLAALAPELRAAKDVDKAIRLRLKELLDPYSEVDVPGVAKFTYKYGKASEKIDGAGLLEYVEHLIYLHNCLVTDQHYLDKYGPEAAETITFDRTHWVTPKPGTRTLRPTFPKE